VDVLLLHSALGLRPAVRRAADRLTAAGHRVQVPGSGHVFDDEDHADHDPASAALLWGRALAELAELDR